MVGTALAVAALLGYALLAARANTGFALGSDLGLWLLWPATGARPYMDFTDCKPPGIYGVAFACHRLGGGTVVGARRIFEGLSLAVLALVAWQKGPLAATFLAVFLLSVHFEAADAWLERLSTMTFVVALMVDQPAIAGLAAFATILTNLKLVLPVLVFFGTAGRPLPLVTLACVGFAALAGLLCWPPGRSLLVEWVAVPFAILRRRYQSGTRSFGSLWNGRATLLGGPLVALAFINTGSTPLTMAAATYVLVNAVGRVWWPYHWIPLGMLCLGDIGPWSACFLVADALGARLFVGPVQERLWGSRATLALAAQKLGRWLHDVPGSLWVAHEVTQVYVYAGKPPEAHGVAQYELDQVRRVGPGAPEWVVVGPGSTWGRPGYRWMHTVPPFSVLRREDQSAGVEGASAGSIASS